MASRDYYSTLANEYHARYVVGRAEAAPVGSEVKVVRASSGTVLGTDLPGSSQTAVFKPQERTESLSHGWVLPAVQALVASATLLLIVWSGRSRTRSLILGQKLIKDERERIAQELHDTFLQDIIAARMLGRRLTAGLPDSENRECADTIMSLLESATTAARESVTSLSSFDEVSSVSEAVAALSEQCLAKCGPNIEVFEQGAPWHIPSQQRYFITRVVREAVANACKHASATTVRVQLAWRWWKLTITIEDDGVGIPDINQVVRGYGLDAMQRLSEAGNLHLALFGGDGVGLGVSIRSYRRLF
ncbi:MAG: ATP-binding protein [Pseudomonadota bacterium]